MNVPWQKETVIFESILFPKGKKINIIWNKNKTKTYKDHALLSTGTQGGEKLFRWAEINILSSIWSELKNPPTENTLCYVYFPQGVWCCQLCLESCGALLFAQSIRLQSLSALPVCSVSFETLALTLPSQQATSCDKHWRTKSSSRSKIFSVPPCSQTHVAIHLQSAPTYLYLIHFNCIDLVHLKVLYTKQTR